MTEAELGALIARGEGQRLECRAADADAAAVAKSIVALANGDGGTLLLGVDDDGRVIGLRYAQQGDEARRVRTLPDLAAWRQWVVNVSRHTCEPAVSISVEHVVADGKDVLAVRIPAGQDAPNRANGRVYVRVDRETHAATREEMLRLLLASGRVPYESLPAVGATLADLDEAVLRDYFQTVRRVEYPDGPDERAQLLTNVGFAIRAAGRTVPTVAGLLLFGHRPQDALTSATLKCAFFYGTDPGSQLRDRADLYGPIPQLIDAGAAFVARNRRLMPRMEGIRRVDVPEYPDYSVREALANALAHRDWALEGAKVRLFMFDDRLEIWSPGTLPSPVRLERLGYDQFSRNRLLARCLLERGYMEEVGLGIRRIRAELAQLGLPAPRFREDGFSFVVTLPSASPREGSPRSEARLRALLARGAISARQYRALEYAHDHGSITRREYVELAGVSVRTAHRDLSELVEGGILETTPRRGRSTTYRVSGDNVE